MREGKDVTKDSRFAVGVLSLILDIYMNVHTSATTPSGLERFRASLRSQRDGLSGAPLCELESRRIHERTAWLGSGDEVGKEEYIDCLPTVMN